jgi:hypothetical protein
VCVWGGVAEDCSYASLFKHLNLNNKTDSQVHLRPVRNWTTPTVVRVNMVVYGIIEVVGVPWRVAIGPIVPQCTI